MSVERTDRVVSLTHANKLKIMSQSIFRVFFLSLLFLLLLFPFAPFFLFFFAFSSPMLCQCFSLFIFTIHFHFTARCPLHCFSSFFCFIQHTPVHFTGTCVSKGHIEDLASHSPEYCTLKRFGEEIRQHIFSRTVRDLYLSPFNTVCDKIITYVQMLGTLATGCHFPITVSYICYLDKL